MQCHECKLDYRSTHDVGCGTGYALTSDGKAICYDCCAKHDRESMIQHGDSKRLPLYLHTDAVTNWPGTLRFKVTGSKTGYHNIAGKRTDVWFNGPDGHIWHGVTYGEFTEVCHCKRTKQAC